MVATQHAHTTKHLRNYLYTSNVSTNEFFYNIVAVARLIYYGSVTAIYMRFRWFMVPAYVAAFCTIRSSHSYIGGTNIISYWTTTVNHVYTCLTFSSGQSRSWMSCYSFLCRWSCRPWYNRWRLSCRWCRDRKCCWRIRFNSRRTMRCTRCFCGFHLWLGVKRTCSI